jgi:hypothetical protein
MIENNDHNPSNGGGPVMWYALDDMDGDISDLFSYGIFPVGHLELPDDDGQ